MLIPDFNFIDRIRMPQRDSKGLAMGWWGRWQRDMVRHMLDHDRCTVQGASQTAGKSFCISLVLAGYILCGFRILLGMPTLRQGSRVLLRETLARLAPFEKLLKGNWSRTVGNSLEIVWSNGGSIMALSTDDSARAGIQGYTADILVIDEAHETTREASLDMFLSRIGAALRRGYGKVIISGVGGPASSLIESIKQAGYATFIADDVRIMRDSPDPLPGETKTFADQFAELKLDMLPSQYDQLYRCLPVRVGSQHAALPGLRRSSPPKWGGGLIVKRAGVDIGRFSDQTVLALLTTTGGVDVLSFPLVIPPGQPFPVQARMIADVLQREQVHPRDVTFELDGMGVGLYDCCHTGLTFIGDDGARQEFAPLLPECKGFTLGSQKEPLLEMLAAGTSSGDVVCDNERDFAELASLGFEIVVKPSGKVARKYQHNDKLSAALMATVSKLQIGGVA